MVFESVFRSGCMVAKVIGCLASLVGAPVGAHAASLALASDVWPPFTDTPDNPRIALEIVHTALNRADIAATTEIREFGEVMQALLGGKLDGSAALWWNDDRETYLLYSEPYLENRLVLVGPNGSDTSANGFAALEGKSIALVGSYSYAIAEALAGPEFVRGESLQTNFDDLLAGKVDYMLVDELVIQHLLRHFPKQSEARLSVGSRSMVTRSLHFAIHRDVENAQFLVDTFNERIRDMQIDGTYNEILQLAWIEVDVDGDGNSEMVMAGDKAGTAPPKSGYNLYDYKDVEPTAKEKSQTYVIGGTTYDRWDQVPEDYKRSNAPVESSSAPDDRLFELKF